MNLFNRAKNGDVKNNVISTHKLILDQRKKSDFDVSVIIPVYKAAKFIEQTLDSLAKQTFNPAKFEVVLVDDASSDDTISVIEQYAKNHSDLNIALFQLKQNSGASMAPRNVALTKVTGKYIQFMDADDALGSETLDRELKYANKNQSDVVIGKYVGVNGRGVPQSQFKFGNVAQADIVKHNLMYSLTVHKMYRREFLTENNLTFAEDVRHGEEDKLFNVQVYSYAKVISILADYDYYYVIDFVDGSNSHNTTPIGDVKKVMPSIDRSFNAISDGITDAATQANIKNAYLKRMLSFSIWKNALTSSKRSIAEKKAFFDGLAPIFQQNLTDTDVSKIQEHTSGWLISGVYKGDFYEFLNLLDARSTVNFENVTRLTSKSILGHLAKYTDITLNDLVKESVQLKHWHLQQDKADITVQYSNNILLNRTPDKALIEFKSGKSPATIQVPLAIMRNEIFQGTLDFTPFTQVSKSSNWYAWLVVSYGEYTVRKKLTGNIHSEKFTFGKTKNTVKVDVTDQKTVYVEVKKKDETFALPKLQANKRAFLFTVPVHTNLGDQAITFAEREFIAKYQPDYQIVEIPRNDSATGIQQVREVLQEDDLILLHGGGNMGTLYKFEEKYRQMVLQAFAGLKSPMIIFPQTVFVSGDSQKYANQTRASYNGIENLTIVAREVMSYDLLKELYPDTKVVLTPDIVMSLSQRSEHTRHGIVTAFRRDKEKTVSNDNLEKLMAALSDEDLYQTDTSLMRGDITIKADTRMRFLNTNWSEIASGEVLITDRLHGMIFGFITGTPVVALDNSTHKIKMSYEKWLKDVPFVEFVADATNVEEIVEKIAKVRQAGPDSTPNHLLLDKYQPLVEALQTK